jgi:hypothetical protein
VVSLGKNPTGRKNRLFKPVNILDNGKYDGEIYGLQLRIWEAYSSSKCLTISEVA